MAEENPADSGDQPSSPNQKQQKLQNGLRFLKGSIAGKEEEAWKKVEEEFHKHAVHGKLFKDKFGACIGMNKDSKNFADELFDVMSKRKKLDSQKGITRQQLQEFWEELNEDDLDTRLQIFFDLCDKNDDNKISMEEVKAVMEWTASANKLTNIKENIEYYASLIVEQLDPDRNGSIEIEHMKLLIGELWNPEEAKTWQSQDVSGSRSFVREKIETIKENRKRIWFFTLWLTINLGLFVWKFMEYKEKETFEVMGYCIGIAKGSAETLKFNMGLVLFLACRGTLTKLRQSNFLSSIFPFDDHIYFHMVVGLAICLATFVHMIMHLGCGFPILSRCLSSNLQEIILGQSTFEFNKPSYFDLVFSVPGVTGILMVIIMAYCFTQAIPLFKSSEKKLLIDFNAFWYAHHLLSLLYLLMIFHGFFISLAWDWLNRTTWIYISFPILLYAIERLFSGDEVKVIKSQVSSGDALVALYLEKPKGFKYESGMYLFVKCPEISKFEWCDKNDDNKISMEEVKAVMEWTASANKLTNIKENIEYYASLIVEQLDPDRNGSIEIEHMKLLIGELWNPEEAKTWQSQDVSGSRSFVREKIETIKENRKRIWFFTLWLTINLGLFVWKFMEYKEKETFEVMGYCIGIAKGSAETLKFNMGLVLFLACRGTLTKLRQSNFLSSIFPFDDHIYFHMVVGLAICLATFVHMIMHLGCGFPILSRCLSSNLQEIILGQSTFEFNKPSYFDLVFSVPGVTGILMVIIMAYCFTQAIPLFKSSEKKLLIDFNAFWYAHHLLSLLYLLMIFHGFFISLAWDWLNRTTWIYISFPILLYAIERLFSGDEVKVIKSQVSSGDALVALYLEKPKGFKYESGMYLFVKCPEISKFEWHPFSITSAPGDEYISLHIGKQGDWKGELIKRFKTTKEKDTKASESSEKYPKILMKGPYGAPAQNYKNFDILLLIGLGVGATPMISILKDVLNHIKTNNASQTQTQSTLLKEVSPSTSDTATTKVPKRAYFYWVTSTQESFQWFNGVMNDVANYDDGKVIEMHNHLSSMHKEGDTRSLLVTMLQNIPAQKDVISGTPIRARYGRPNWENVFPDLEKKHQGSKIGVFYCGPAASSTNFRRLCRKHSLGSTKFHFFKENF